MPDKEGSDEKSTKSVVSKKQKQMMGEEGYDIARDMGRVPKTRDKKDATTMPPSKEMEKTRKVYKGPSALELVKKKYKGQIMDVSKKKANEELDLTQVAEAFGGYIVESNGGGSTFSNRKKDQEPLKKIIKRARRARPDLFGDPDATPTNRGRKDVKKQTDSDAPAVDFDRAAKNLSAFTRRVRGDISADDLDAEIRAGRRQEARRKKEVQQIIDPNRRFFTDKPDRETLRTQPTGDEGQFLDKEGKPEPKKLRPATRRKSTATPPAFATRTGESGGPLPVSMRNRRVPKTSSLSPNVNVTSPVTFKGFQDRVKTVTPEIVGGDVKKSAQLSKTPKEGPVIDTTATRVNGRTGQRNIFTGEPEPQKPPKDETRQRQFKPDPNYIRMPRGFNPDQLELDFNRQQQRQQQLPPSQKPDINKLLDRTKKKKFSPSFIPTMEPRREPKTQTEPEGGGIGGRNNIVGTGTGGFGRRFGDFRKFTRRNPALSLIGFDAAKNAADAAGKILNPANFGLRGGRVGRRSARQ